MEYHVTKQKASAELASVPLDSTRDSSGPRDHPDDGTVSLLFARELRDIAAKIEQGVAPSLYQRLTQYRHALLAAQAVAVAFQLQHANNKSDRG